jgi:hypothetical protein
MICKVELGLTVKSKIVLERVNATPDFSLKWDSNQNIGLFLIKLWFPCLFSAGI